MTPREWDCLLWAGEGKTDWEISVIPGISRSTVTKHIMAARAKLGAVKAHSLNPAPSWTIRLATLLLRSRSRRRRWWGCGRCGYACGWGR
nr:helix-turn-helix domain-containing protein [Nitrobacter winogradskyi]